MSLQCPQVVRKGCRTGVCRGSRVEPIALGSRGYQRLRCIHGAEAVVDGVVTYR